MEAQGEVVADPPVGAQAEEHRVVIQSGGGGAKWPAAGGKTGVETRGIAAAEADPDANRWKLR